MEFLKVADLKCIVMLAKQAWNAQQNLMQPHVNFQTSIKTSKYTNGTLLHPPLVTLYLSCSVNLKLTEK